MYGKFFAFVLSLSAAVLSSCGASDRETVTLCGVDITFDLGSQMVYFQNGNDYPVLVEVYRLSESGVEDSGDWVEEGKIVENVLANDGEDSEPAEFQAGWPIRVEVWILDWTAWLRGEWNPVNLCESVEGRL